MYKVILILDKFFVKYEAAIKLTPPPPPEKTTLKKPSFIRVNVRVTCTCGTKKPCLEMKFCPTASFFPPTCIYMILIRTVLARALSVIGETKHQSTKESSIHPFITTIIDHKVPKTLLKFCFSFFVRNSFRNFL